MSDLRHRLEEAIRKTGLTKYAIEKAAGLDRGYLSTILRRGSMGKAAAASLAPVLGVAEGWLLADDTHRDPEPPASDRAPREPARLDGALEAAFDAKRHKLGDALAVQELLRTGLTLSHPEQAEALARALLDGAAHLRRGGYPVTKDALLEALALRVSSLESMRAAG
jgi:hypothetical protein